MLLSFIYVGSRVCSFRVRAFSVVFYQPFINCSRTFVLRVRFLHIVYLALIIIFASVLRCPNGPVYN